MRVFKPLLGSTECHHSGPPVFRVFKWRTQIWGWINQFPRLHFFIQVLSSPLTPLAGFRGSTSVGPGGRRLMVLKHCQHEIAPLGSHLLNVSSRVHWAKASITPAPKHTNSTSSETKPPCFACLQLVEKPFHYRVKPTLRSVDDPLHCNIISHPVSCLNTLKTV